MNEWTETQLKFLIENYKDKGADFCATSLGKSKQAILYKAVQLSLRPWTNEETEFLKNNRYKGRKYCAEVLNRSPSMIERKIREFGLQTQFQWTEQECQFLKDNYEKFGPNYCAEKLNRSRKAVLMMTWKLDLNHRSSRYWTKEQNEFLKENKHLDNKELAQKLNTTEKVISERRRVLDLPTSREEQSNLKLNETKTTGTKTCNHCIENKNIKHFRFHKDGGYYGNICKQCRNKKRSNKYFTDSSYNLKIKNKRKEKYLKNRDKIIEKVCKYAERKRETDAMFRLIHNMRGRIRDVVKRDKQSKRTKEILGCEKEFFRQYIESQFKDGMNWNNYGSGHNKWNLDHIIPISSFDLNKEEDIKKCFHYTNYQPLWFLDNMSKGAKLPHEWEKEKGSREDSQILTLTE